MKTNGPLNDDQALGGLLNEWKVDTPLPPHFEQRVWRRIERDEAQSVATPWMGRALRDWIANLLPRPALALAYCAVLLATGAGIGWTQARHESSLVSSQLRQRYVKSVDPFQTQP